MPYHNRLKTPEEIELARKREELSRHQLHLAELESSFALLKEEIRGFEQRYESRLGERIRALEELEWQVRGLLEGDDAQGVDETPICEEGATHFHRRTDLLDEEENSPPGGARKSLKSLYREVAKAIHPDLASDDEERLRRQELMAIANRAYGDGDRAALEEILSDWELGPEAGDEDVALELVRVIRLIARVRQNIHAILRQMEELKATDIYRFRLRVEEAAIDGIDLMAEMASRVDLDILKTRQRLAGLRGENGGGGAAAASVRLLRFPADHSCGMLYERCAGSMDFRDWQRLGPARGLREVMLDRAVRLDVKGKRGDAMSFLDQLPPDALQSLFLYDIDDAALKHLVHLSGLSELYLSDTGVTDQGLRLLSSLRGLRRLSIYHTAIGDAGLEQVARLEGLKWLTCSGTAITEEGLSRFRRLVPGCKAVNFLWRHGR